MKEIRNEHLERAKREVIGRNATLPWIRAINIDDSEAIKEAGEEARKINERQIELQEEDKLKKPLIEKPEPVEG